MHQIKILNQQEKNNIIGKLNEQFGVEQLQGILLMFGKEKLYLFSGSLSEKELEKLIEITNIEKTGFYFAKIDERTGDIRLSIEATQLLQNQIKKNIFELDDRQVNDWMSGSELLIKTNLKGFVIIKHKKDFLGSGKASENKIGNFIPKERRLKKRDV